jgi:hypothetical protein
VHGARIRGDVPVVVAQHADETVDVADGVPGDVLDGLDRLAGAGGVALLQQAGRAGLHQDHGDRVAGRVVQLPRDAGALVSGDQVPLAFGVGLEPAGVRLCLGEPQGA